MPLPDSLISICTLICEKVLTEPDGVNSAIRIVDVFSIETVLGVPRERQAISITILTLARTRGDDKSEHWLQLDLLRPSGERVKLGEIPKAIPDARTAGVGGFNAVVQVGIVIKEAGLHYIITMFDGQDVQRIPFTLLEQDLKTSSGGSS